MRQHYKVRFKRYHRYIRYFVIGFIFAALVFGSVAMKATLPDTPAEPCEPYWEGCDPSEIERCDPGTPKVRRSCDGRVYSYPIYIHPCPKSRIPCPLEKEG